MTRDSRRPSSTHGKSAPVRPRAAGISSEAVLEDLLAGATATALQLSSTGVKQLARAGGISSQSASRWRLEGRGNPAHEYSRIVYHLSAMGQRAGALVALAMTALRHGQMPLSDDDLVRRFWDLMESENAIEGRGNQVQSTFAVRGNLEALERAATEIGAVATELAACCRELRRRRIDPRQHAA